MVDRRKIETPNERTVIHIDGRKFKIDGQSRERRKIDSREMERKKMAGRIYNERKMEKRWMKRQ